MAIHIDKKRGSKKGERSVVEKKARITLQSTDVLMGRGGTINLFEGNKNFRAIVRSHKKSYQEACREKKGLIAKQIVRKIEQQEPPGRFLKREKDGYSILKFKKALEKTSQALRDCKNNKNDSVVVKTPPRSRSKSKKSAKIKIDKCRFPPTKKQTPTQENMKKQDEEWDLDDGNMLEVVASRLYTDSAAKKSNGGVDEGHPIFDKFTILLPELTSSFSHACSKRNESLPLPFSSIETIASELLLSHEGIHSPLSPRSAIDLADCLADKDTGNEGAFCEVDDIITGDFDSDNEFFQDLNLPEIFTDVYSKWAY